MAFGLSTFTSVVARAKRLTHRRRQRTGGNDTNHHIIQHTSTAAAMRATTVSSSFCCTTPTAYSKSAVRSSSDNTTVLLDSPTSSMAASSSAASLASLASSTSSHTQHLQGWMYWARYDDAPQQRLSCLSDSADAATPTAASPLCASPVKHQTVTKVYAVLRNEFLVLYRDNRKLSTSKSRRNESAPLIQIAVDRAGRSIDGAFHVFDPHGNDMELHLYDRSDAATALQWALALEQAAELTHAYFATFDVKVEHLSRSSLYRGTLHDFRASQAQRTSVHDKVRASFAALAPLRASTARLFGRCGSSSSSDNVSMRCA